MKSSKLEIWERIWPKVKEVEKIPKLGACWEYQSVGRPRIRVDGKSVFVSRWVLETTEGTPLGDLCALHHCDNDRCINPRHLYRGSHQDNVRDRVKRGRSKKHQITTGFVLKIKKRLSEGVSARELAERYDVSIGTIYNISSGKSKGWFGKGSRWDEKQSGKRSG